MAVEETYHASGGRVMPLPLGTQTEWGKIEMVGITGGERYYWMVDKHKCVSMIPSFMVEQVHNDAIQGPRIGSAGMDG